MTLFVEAFVWTVALTAGYWIGVGLAHIAWWTR